VKLIKGTVQTNYKHARSVEYAIKNSGGKTKKVLVEYPYDANWKLIAPENPAEKTRDLYRFAVQAEPGKPAKLAVEEERTINQQVAITNLDDNTIAIYLNAKVVSDKVKAALQEIVKQKKALQEVAQKKQQLQQQIAVIDQEQARIRQNMAQLDRNTDLYKRYIGKFAMQEDLVEKLRGQMDELQSQETKLRQALDAYMLSLDLA
jgi:hypothetical protein